MTYHYNPDRISLEEIQLKKRRNWKPVIVGIILVLVAAYFIFAEHTLNEKMKSISGAFLSSIGVVEKQENENVFTLEKSIDFNSDFNFTGPIKFNFPVFKLDVSFDTINSKWNIGNEVLKFSNNGSTEIELYGFKGEVIAGDIGYINGTCDKIFVNGIELYPGEHGLRISTTGLKYNKIEMSDVEMPGFDEANLNGNIHLNNADINVNGDSVRFGKFKGKISVEDNKISFDGSTEKIEVISDNTITVS